MNIFFSNLTILWLNSLDMITTPLPYWKMFKLNFEQKDSNLSASFPLSDYVSTWRGFLWLPLAFWLGLGFNSLMTLLKEVWVCSIVVQQIWLISSVLDSSIGNIFGVWLSMQDKETSDLRWWDGIQGSDGNFNLRTSNQYFFFATQFGASFSRAESIILSRLACLNLTLVTQINVA